MRRKHALTLQVHTAHILSAHASLDEKGKALQDVKEQKNRCVLSIEPEFKANTCFLSTRLESERARLLNCLREVSCVFGMQLNPFYYGGQVNEDRDKVGIQPLIGDDAYLCSRLTCWRRRSTRSELCPQGQTAVSTNEGHGRCDDLRSKIQTITDGEYSNSKREVDKLRQELGQEPLPSLQNMLDEKSAALSLLILQSRHPLMSSLWC